MFVVTGASGYLGSHITKKLVENGHQVRAVVHNKDRAEREGRLQGVNVDWVNGNVMDLDSLKLAFQDASAVIHTVAIAIEKGGRTYEDINYQGTVNAVDATQELGIKRFINISQLGASSDLPYRFLASKGKAQEYVAVSTLDWTTFRPAVIWGPEDEFANTFAKLVPITPVIFPIIGDTTTKFQPVWVEDVVSCVIQALENPQGTIYKEFELAGPEILTLEEIERRTLQAINRRRKLVHFPIGLLRVIVAFMEAIFPSPPVTKSLLELLQVSNVSTANQITKFVSTPRPFTAEYISTYMKEFRFRDTISQFLGK